MSEKLIFFEGKEDFHVARFIFTANLLSKYSSIRSCLAIFLRVKFSSLACVIKYLLCIKLFSCSLPQIDHSSIWLGFNRNKYYHVYFLFAEFSHFQSFFCSFFIRFFARIITYKREQRKNYYKMKSFFFSSPF